MFRQAMGHGQNALSRRHTCRIRHGVRGFDHLDALNQPCRPRWRVAVTRDDQPAQWRFSGPKRLDRLRHRAARLARTQHKRAALLGIRRGWQKTRGVVQRQSALHRHAEQVLQKLAGRNIRLK